MNARYIPPAVRAVLTPAQRKFIDRFAAHPAVAEISEGVEREDIEERLTRVKALAAVAPSYVKRLEAAGRAVNAAVKLEEETAAAAHRARVALNEARSHAQALEQQCRIEQDTLRRELVEGAQPILADGLAVLRAVSLNRFLPDLGAGEVKPSRGLFGWIGLPERKEAPGMEAWRLAAKVLDEAIGTLEAHRLEALSSADAAEAVSIELRKVTEAFRPLKAGKYSINRDGQIVRDDPESLERTTFDNPGRRTATEVQS